MTTYQERLQELLGKVITRETHKGSAGRIIVETLAAINALDAETIKSSEENFGNGMPLCNPDDLRQRFGINNICTRCGKPTDVMHSCSGVRPRENP